MSSIRSKTPESTLGKSGSTSSSTLISRSNSPQQRTDSDTGSQGDAQKGDERKERITNLQNVQKNRETDQHAEIWTSTRVTREAANPDSYVTLHDSGLNTLGLQSLTVGSSVGDNSATATLDRAGMLARGATSVDGHTVTGAGGIIAAHGYGEMAIQTGAYDSITVGTLNGKGVHAGGFTATQGTATMAVNEGSFAIGNAKQYAEAKQSEEGSGRVQVAYTDKKVVGLQVTAAASHGPVGVGIRGFISRSKDYQYTTWVSPEEAGPAFQNQSLVRQKLRSMGLMKSYLKRPDLQHPLDTLKIGDIVSTVGQTTLTGGVAAAFSGIYIGLHASRNTDQWVTVERMSTTVVRVTATPKHNTSITIGISADVPLLGAATASRSSSVGKAYTFDFDVTVPSAQRAYEAMLQRHMPSNNLKVDHSVLDDTQETMRVLSQELNLPHGVSLVSLMHQERPKDITLAAGLTLLPNLLGDQVGMMGVRRRKGESNVISVDESSVVKHAEAAQETQSGFVRRGKVLSEAKLVHITKDTIVGGTVESHEEIYLQASLKHERPSGDTRHHMLAWMNKHFYEKVRKFAEEPYDLHHKYGYGLTVKRALSDDDLRTLWLDDSIDGMPLFNFNNDDKRPTEEQKAQIIAAIKTAITSGGIKELSRIQKVLGDGDKLHLEVKHDAISVIEKRFLKNAIKFAKPIDNNTLVGELIQRINAAKKYYRSLEIAERDIREDFFAADINEAAVKKSIASIAEKRAKTPDFLTFKGMTRTEATALRNQLSQAQLQLLQQLTVSDPTGKARRGLVKAAGLLTPIF